MQEKISDWLAELAKYQAIAVIRASQSEIAYQSAKALAAGGIKFIEITWNTPDAAHLIATLRQEMPTCCIGTGTILNLEMAKKAIASDAQFMFTPHVDLSIISYCQAQGLPIIPGALTPTEIITAWNQGATAVKVFPIKSVGGAKYLECLHPVMPQIPLIPTGGVNLENACDFLEVGAIAVGISTALLPPDLVSSYISSINISGINWQVISDRAQDLVLRIKARNNNKLGDGDYTPPPT